MIEVLQNHRYRVDALGLRHYVGVRQRGLLCVKPRSCDETLYYFYASYFHLHISRGSAILLQSTQYYR